MDKIWRTISGMVLAGAMTIAMANRTYAENDETVFPETPPAAIAESTVETPDPAQETVSEEEDVSSEEETSTEETDSLEKESAGSEDETASSEEKTVPLPIGCCW